MSETPQKEAPATPQPKKSVDVGPGECPCGYGYVRDDGTRCYGGTHTVDEGDAKKHRSGEASGNANAGAGPVKPGQVGVGNCPHGFGFNRDNGTRCFGGTHLTYAEEERRRRDATSQRADAKGAGDCDRGYDFTREDGTRCKGGSHKLETDAERRRREGAAQEEKPKVFRGMGICDHGYAFNRDNGTRCKGGTHLINDPANSWMKSSNSGGNAQGGQANPNGAQTHVSCPHGFGFSRDNGTRCFGGTHRANGNGAEDAKNALAGEASQQASLAGGGICDRGYDFTRENGTRCAGGTHRISSANEKKSGGASALASGATKGLGICDHGFDFNRDNGTRCKGGSHVVAGADFSAGSGTGAPNHSSSRPEDDGMMVGVGICPHGFGFNRDNGTRCFGGTHRSKKVTPM